MKVEYFKLMIYEEQQKLFDMWVKTNDDKYYQKLLHCYEMLDCLEEE